MRNLNKTFVIAKYTASEILRSKIIYNILFLGFALVLITYTAYSFTHNTASRVALDFGLGMLSISSVGIALFFGSTLIAKELSSKTVYMIISRPVPRSVFILGKLLGLALILLLNILILSLMSFSVYFLVGGKFTSMLVWAILFIGLESLVTLFLVTFLSLLTNQVLSVIFTIIIYISGHAINETIILSFVENREGVAFLLKAYQYILPAFHKLNIKEIILYEQNLGLSYLFSTFGYGVCYLMMILILTLFTFNRKNLD